MVFVHGLYPGEQFLVQQDVVGMFRQYRWHFLCQLVHLVVGFCTQQVEEHIAHPAQQIVGDAEWYGVVERGRFRILDDGVRQFVILPYAFHESRFVIFEVYPVERCRVVRRSVGRAEKRIFSFFGLVFLYDVHVDICIF